MHLCRKDAGKGAIEDSEGRDGKCPIRLRPQRNGAIEQVHPPAVAFKIHADPDMPRARGDLPAGAENLTLGPAHGAALELYVLDSLLVAADNYPGEITPVQELSLALQGTDAGGFLANFHVASGSQSRAGNAGKTVTTNRGIGKWSISTITSSMSGKTVSARSF